MLEATRVSRDSSSRRNSTTSTLSKETEQTKRLIRELLPLLLILLMLILVLILVLLLLLLLLVGIGVLVLMCRLHLLTLIAVTPG
mmetsp:Transcript_9733/g.19023  ORF Transcript_9733/g.19023 Transcript_9733/m.19023 type:complete len:85 (-) Transcript_9733:101-355(-)